jgi:hypothetical protein
MQHLIAEMEKLGLETRITALVELITIYNATEGSKNAVIGQKEVILEQNTGSTSHFIIRN